MDACPGKRLLIILKFETTAHPTETSIPETSLTPLARDRAIKACDSERCNWLVEPSLDQCHRILHCEMFCKIRVYCSRSGWMSRWGWHSIGKFTISHGWYHMGGIWEYGQWNMYGRHPPRQLGRTFGSACGVWVERKITGKLKLYQPRSHLVQH